MPGFDGTGPRGLGPMTGGGRGFCSPYGLRSPAISPYWTQPGAPAFSQAPAYRPYPAYTGYAGARSGYGVPFGGAFGRGLRGRGRGGRGRGFGW